MKVVVCVALWFLWSVGGALAEARTVRVGIEGDRTIEARREAMFGGDACPAIDTFQFTRPSRIDAELLILCNALREGGSPVHLQLVSQPNYTRSLAEAIAGRLDLPSQTIWSSELDEHADTLLRSLPVIQAGEWEVGLYTTANRAEELIDVQNNDGIFPMIQAGRADFTLYTFSTDADLGSRPTYSPSRILPIKGFKVALPVTRHFAVARAAPDAQALVRQLDTGLSRLRDRGAIKRVFERSGVFEPRVADWQLIGNK
jgi:hypothetical protein